MSVIDHFHLEHWSPMTTAPHNRAIELRVLEHGEVVALPFPCARNNADRWINSDLGTSILVNPVEWRIEPR